MRFSTTLSTSIAMLPALTGVFANLDARQNNDPQTSLTIDPKVLATGFANNGQDVPVAGQVASLTSTNNFINFCLTVPNLPITNGKQITTGSCNPAPIGAIPTTELMPSSKFTNPKNGDTIPANTAFTINMAISNIVTGHFVNAQESYFAAPQQLDATGTIIGHSHVVVEAIQSFTQTTPTNPKQFAFFKGMNIAAINGVLSADVAAGLPAGTYRLCSMNAAQNHQPVIVAVAQHGSLDDCVYFTAAGGNGTAAATGVAGVSTTAATGASTAAAGTISTSVAAGTKATTTAKAGTKATATAKAGTKVATPPAATAIATTGKGAGRGGRGRGRREQSRVYRRRL